MHSSLFPSQFLDAQCYAMLVIFMYTKASINREVVMNGTSSLSRVAYSAYLSWY